MDIESYEEITPYNPNDTDPDVSIIIPIYKPNPEILIKVDYALKHQDYGGKIEILKLQRGGFGATFNAGLKQAKNEILISLHQDCVPDTKDWIRKLVEPLKDKDVLASVSKVELPYEYWKTFDPIGKILSSKEQKIITPLLDEKGVANKKSAIIKAGLFDTTQFATAGEDFDMYIKLCKIGKIAYPDIKVIHYHKHTYKNRFKKELQLSNSFGALVGIYGRSLPHWYVGFLKAIPIIGWPFFLLGLNVKKLKFNILLAIPLYLIINIIYSIGFWRGFLSKKQTQLL